MAIETINIGTIANDGTGDDLREAFRKVNDNFEILDLRDPESTTASNLGDIGEGIFASKNGDDLQFKKLNAGSNISLTATGNYITIDAQESISQLTFVTDSGSKIINTDDFLNIFGGQNINTALLNGDTVSISVDGTDLLLQDGSPTLAAPLDANNKNISNINQASATLFSGPLEGAVWGIDIRTLSSSVDALYNFDLNAIYPVYTNAIEYLLGQQDIDMGDIVGPGVNPATIDLGTI